MNNRTLEKYLNTMMKIHEFEDYTPNGLQIEGSENILYILTSPSLSLAVIEKAVELGVQAILVHHGMFWKNDSHIIQGPYKSKLKKILMNDLNLFAYHLPLDFLNKFGNNAPVLSALKISDIKPFENIGYMGRFKKPMEPADFSSLLNRFYQTSGIHIAKKGKIKTIAVVSGNGVSYFQKAIEKGVDAFITGESSEWVYNLAKENNVSFSAMGHYKSECIGIKLLGEHIHKKFKVKVDFFSEDNPF